MTYPWAESTSEVSTETTSGESPYGESYYPAGESEWGAPFVPAEAEQGPFEYGQEYGQEALSPDTTEAEAEWESPFATSGLAADSEIMRTPEQFPKTCGDTTFDGKPWTHGLRNKKPEAVGGWASEIRFIPHAEVFAFGLAQFDVDRHELKAPHKKIIAEVTQRVQAGIREGRYSGTDPIRVFTYGETSTTASGGHNAALSRNRAFNALHAIRCEFQKVGITHPAVYGFYGTSEQHARQYGPDNKEDAKFRGVVVRIIGPLKECKKCETPVTGTSTICVTVPKIAPRVATKLPPDVIPLGSVVPGLRLPIAIVTRAQATVRVDEQRSRKSGQYTFQGWGLEIALPAGRTRIDIQADLRASIEVLMRASASLGAKLRLGPLKLSLRVDVSVFASLIAKLCAQLRVHIDANLGRANLPELAQCRLVEARGVRGPFPFAALAGPGLLVVPGAGYGPGLIHFSGPGVPGLQLSANPILVPADKSTVKTLLVLGGNLQLASAAAREAEYELPEAEWPEAFAELQPELAPFV